MRSAGKALLASYAYDALGRRISSSIGGVTTLYVYDGQNLIEERDGSGARGGLHLHR